MVAQHFSRSTHHRQSPTADRLIQPHFDDVFSRCRICIYRECVLIPQLLPVYPAGGGERAVAGNTVVLP